MPRRAKPQQANPIQAKQRECLRAQQIREHMPPRKDAASTYYIVLDPPNFQEKPEIQVIKG